MPNKYSKVFIDFVSYFKIMRHNRLSSRLKIFLKLGIIFLIMRSEISVNIEDKGIIEIR